MGAVVYNFTETRSRRRYAATVEDFVSRRPLSVSEADMFSELERLEMIRRATEAYVKVIAVMTSGLEVAQTSNRVDLTHTKRCILEVVSDDINLTPEAWAVLVAEEV
jgi:hypothetical protein